MSHYAQDPSSPPHYYSQALQLKLYQAFIFSIPVLFSIILFLLFYLFYLRRRAYSSTLIASSQSLPPATSNQDGLYVPSPHEIGLKDDLKDKLPIVLFDDHVKAKGSQCCVCLGDFEIKEELHQVPSCEHFFHVECLRHWLHSNSTCPLCRCLVIPSIKTRAAYPPFGPLDLLLQENQNANNHQTLAIVSTQQQEPWLQQEVQPTIDLNSADSLASDDQQHHNPQVELPCTANESIVLHI